MDPIYFFLKTILKDFFVASLQKEEETFVEDNIQKHRKILWLNVFAGITTPLGLNALPAEQINIVVSLLIAPVMVLGTAWFTISFGGIPPKLYNVAMSVTFWLFSAFSLSLTIMFFAVGFVTSAYLWPFLIFIYLSTLIACIQYDTADGLKVGLDEALLKHSRAALRYYGMQGIKEDTD